MVVQHINKNIPRKLKIHVEFFLHVHVLSISNKSFRSMFLQLMELINVFVKALMLAYFIMEESRELGKNLRRTRDRNSVTCLYPGSIPGRSSDKRVSYHCAIQIQKQLLSISNKNP